MKKLTKFVLTFLVITVFIACEKDNELTPQDALTNEDAATSAKIDIANDDRL